jgi:hypothetical protein
VFVGRSVELGPVFDAEAVDDAGVDQVEFVLRVSPFLFRVVDFELESTVPVSQSVVCIPPRIQYGRVRMRFVPSSPTQSVIP